MRKIAFLLFFVFIVMLGVHFFSKTPSTFGERFRADADTARLEHLIYWAGLIDEYHDRTGRYPLQDWIQEGEDARLVRIINKTQRRYAVKGGDKYMPAADVDPKGIFPEAGMKDFIATLQAGLKRVVAEKYDIQQIPTTAPVGYYYFATRDGYVLWGTCLRCGVTSVTTLLSDGKTPIINIASRDMLDKVTKGQMRAQLVTDPEFRKLAEVPYHKEGYVRAIEQKHLHDSKH